MSSQSGLPVFLTGTVVHGAGRGGSQLGFPTANIDPSCFQKQLEHIDAGVYYGYARVLGLEGEVAEPMVMSIGLNLTFEDSKNKTAEVHILKKFNQDFYGNQLQVVILGYIRDMLKFDGLESLIAAINNDISVARSAMERPEVSIYKNDPYFSSP